jgi:hypothetical protein
MLRSLSLLAGLALGAALSQFPQYAADYQRNLADSVHQLDGAIADFDRMARRGGLTREEALSHYQASSDPFLHRQGTGMQAALARHDGLARALAGIEAAGPWQQVLILPDYADPRIAGQTLAQFRPGLPTAPQAYAWAAAGLVIGYVAVATLIELLALPFYGWRPRRRWRELEG